MSSLEKKKSTSISLLKVEETGMSLKVINGNLDLSEIYWQIGFRLKPSVDISSNIIGVEVRAAAENSSIRSEIASISVLATYRVENMNEYVSYENDANVKIDNILLANILSPAFGTLRGVILTRFKGTVLENLPLPLIDIHQFVKPKRKH